MDKFAVVIDDEKSKTASQGKDAKCPGCGAFLPAGQIQPWCITCGTKPFEKRPEEK